MPDDLVLTPGGYRPQSVVHLVEPGSFLQVSEGNLQKCLASGKLVTDFGPAPVRPAGTPLHPANVVASAGAKVPGLGTGWITYASWTDSTGKPIKSFKTTWMVPPAPTTQSGQLIFLFNGIQNSSMIYQPVLERAYPPRAEGITGRSPVGTSTARAELLFTAS